MEIPIKKYCPNCGTEMKGKVVEHSFDENTGKPDQIDWTCPLHEKNTFSFFGESKTFCKESGFRTDWEGRRFASYGGYYM